MSMRWPSARALINTARIRSVPGILPSEVDEMAEPAPTAPTEVPGNLARWLDQMRQDLATLPGAPSAFSGSNTFAWSGKFCQETVGEETREYPGLLGDPHQPIPSYLPTVAVPNPTPADFFAQAFKDTLNHLWFAHVKVTPPGATQPSLDVLGHVPHGAATFFTSHNRNVAMGGTQGAPNHVDVFLLRLREAPDGTPATPLQHYSYYHDGSHTNDSWQDLVPTTVALPLPGGTTLSVPCWRAGSFGVVLPEITDLQLLGAAAPLPVVYGERVDDVQQGSRWRVGWNSTEPRMKFWSAPWTQSGQVGTSPMVVALRAPIDDHVAGEAMHWQLLRDFWEIAHANTVFDVIDKTNGGAYLANLCFVDRQGRTFSTQATAIPQRGDDTLLALAPVPYHSKDKAAIYNLTNPVPARCFADKMFDWQFGSYSNPAKPAPLRYLQYPPGQSAFNRVPNAFPQGTAVAPFKPMTLQDRVTNSAFPPQRVPQPGAVPFDVESGGFASACNDQIWGFSRKRDDVQPQVTSAFNDIQVPNNKLLEWVLDAGVIYQTAAMDIEGPDRQQLVVQRFTKQLELGPQAMPPLTPAEMSAFVVTPRLYNDDDYDPTNPIAALPTPIRQWKEVVNGYPAPGPLPLTAPRTGPGGPVANESPLQTAQRELRFFDDLWSTLFSPAWDNHTIAGISPATTVSLRDLWLGVASGNPGHVFWYGDPNNPAGSFRWIELPEHFPLIDFYWAETDLSRDISGTVAAIQVAPRTVGQLAAGGAAEPLSSTEATTFQQVVNQMVTNWNLTMAPASTDACLFEMTRQGYGATGATFGRHWVWLRQGEVMFTSSSGAQWLALATSGQLPASSGTLDRQWLAWSALAPLAFPYSQGTDSTLLKAKGVAIPYDALYDTSVTPNPIRSTLQPQHINQLVEFFLKLGNYYIDPQQNFQSPSTKLARYTLVAQRLQQALSLLPQPRTPTQDEIDDAFLTTVPVTYPLTDGLLRLTAVRALIDAKAFLTTLSPTPLAFRDCFRTRAFDHNGLRWPNQGPNPADGADCYGGALRAVTWHEEPAGTPGHQPFRGFQPKFFGMGGSIATLLAMFPSTQPSVDSRFWCTPGVQVMSQPGTQFDAHMQAFATNVLIDTRYGSYSSPGISGPPTYHYY